MRKKGATNTTRIDRLTLKVFGHDVSVQLISDKVWVMYAVGEVPGATLGVPPCTANVLSKYFVSEVLTISTG